MRYQFRMLCMPDKLFVTEIHPYFLSVTSSTIKTSSLWKNVMDHELLNYSFKTSNVCL